MKNYLVPVEKGREGAAKKIVNAGENGRKLKEKGWKCLGQNAEK